MVALNDGRFEVMLVRNPSTPMQLSTILHGVTTVALPNDMIHFFSAKHICVSCESFLEWTLDGERAEGAPLVEMQNLHSAVRIVIPKQDNADESGEE